MKTATKITRATKLTAVLTGSLIALAAWATTAASQGEESAQIDSILDRLEKHLMDQESDVLQFEDGSNPSTVEAAPAPSSSNLTKYKFKKKGAIQAKPEEMRQLDSLAQAISELENQTEQLASEVQKTKQTIIEGAAVNNFIAIETQLSKTDVAAIRTLQVKLDGYDIYRIDDASGLWLPTKKMPLYAGPLQPGNHRVDLEARIVMKHDKGLPMNNDVYRFINKSFELTVPHGLVHKKFVVHIEPPKDLKGNAKATIKEYVKK